MDTRSTFDWSTLNEKTKSLTTNTSIQDRERVIRERVYSGLEVKLSDVVQGAPDGGFPLLNIYADTLVMDVDSFSARGGIIVARSLDLSQIHLDGGAITLPVPASSSGTTVFQLLVNEVTGGPLRVRGGSAGTPETIPIGSSPLQSVIVSVRSDGSIILDVRSQPESMADLLARGWPLCSLKASFTAASSLSSSAALSDRRLAAAMLAWIVAIVASFGSTEVPGAFPELYNQAASLLVPLNTAEGALYVPVLSSDVYKNQINVLLDSLASYEQMIGQLQTAQDIGKAVADVASTLMNVAVQEQAPIQVDLTQVTANIKTLYAEIQDLQGQFSLQYSDCDARYAIMASAIAQEQIVDFLKASFKVVLDVLSFGVGVAMISLGDPEAVGESLGAVAGLVTMTQELTQAAIDAGDKANAPGSEGRELLAQAKALMAWQGDLLASFQAAVILWAAAQRGAGAPASLPSLGAVSVDADLAWSNYVVAAQAELDVIKQGATSSLAAIENYEASLEILANYGKAIGAKLAIYSAQVARAVVLTTQLRSAQNIEADWKAMQAQTRSDAEQRAALIGVLQSRANDIRRSVFVSFTYFNDSWFYLYFVAPPVIINVDMSVPALKDALSQVSLWIDRLLGVFGAGDKVELPNTNVTVTFEFAIYRSGADAVGVDYALLTPAAGSRPASLIWNIPIGTSQLLGVFPSHGNVALWVTEATFFVEGIKPNAKGNVVSAVSTSGSYANGFGTKRAYRFVTNGLVSSYGYKAGASSPYIPWVVNPLVYMSPTAYTQWSMIFDADGGDPSGATKLTVNMTVAFRRDGL